VTPIEITVPSLGRYGYARKNIYENCTAERVVRCLERRRFLPTSNRYGYSDFAYAILAVVAEAVTETEFSTLFEGFIREDLNLKNTTVELDPLARKPLAVRGGKIMPFWQWRRSNPYLAGGGMVSNIGDMLSYLALQTESNLPYIKEAHTVCEASRLKRDNHLMCIGWHSYKRSNQLWHVGGVGTFRSSLIFNRKRRYGVAVLGNAKGKSSANVHYIAKMLYSELKKNKINLKEN
jgi:CubicO group peptidase (beta-lactamase class C family)